MPLQCSDCQEEVNEGAQTCPHCGWCPKYEKRKAGYLLIGGGIVATVTLIGSVIGVPMIVYGIMQFHKAQELTVDHEFN